MGDHSMPASVGDSSGGSLQYSSSTTVIDAAAAAIVDIVNTTVEELGNGNFSLRNGTAAVVHPDEMFLSVRLLFMAIAIAILIVGISGNAFVVFVIFTDRKLLHSSVNLFLLNLALADMGNLIFCAPDVLFQTMSLQWVLPAVFCPFIRFLQQYFLFASVLLQMSIGIERFMAICTPLQMQRFSRRTTVLFLLLAWTSAALIALPSGIYQRKLEWFDEKMQMDIEYCGFNRHTYPKVLKAILEMVWFAILYCIPLVLLTILYTIMCRRLWGKECMIAGETQQMAILRLRRSVVKMLVISMLIYFICYTPVQSLGFLHWKPPLYGRLILHLLVVVSSAANPIVYIMCCRHFHQRFVAMVNRTIHCCARTPEKYQTVIADADKYARMSVVTHSSISKRHRKVKQRERTADVSLSVRLLPQIDSPREVDVSLGDASVSSSGSSRRPTRMRMRCGRGAYAAGTVAAATAAAAGGVASTTDSPPLLLPPSPSALRNPRTSTTSATSFHWAVSTSPSSNKYRHFRCTNPQKISTASITVD